MASMRGSPGDRNSNSSDRNSRNSGDRADRMSRNSRNSSRRTQVGRATQIKRAPSRVDSFVLKKQYQGNGEKSLQQQLAEMAASQEAAKHGDLRRRVSKAIASLVRPRKSGAISPSFQWLTGDSDAGSLKKPMGPSGGVARSAIEYEHQAMQQRTKLLGEWWGKG